jgi:hypothetical protein
MKNTNILFQAPVMSLNNNLPINLKEILIGTLLGDAHLYKTKDAAYVTFEQSILKQEYLLHLYNLFESYAKHPPKIYDRLDKRYNKVNSSISFRTENLSIFNEFAD